MWWIYPNGGFIENYEQQNIHDAKIQLSGFHQNKKVYY